MATTATEAIQEKTGFVATLKSFSRAFWFANFIEVLERWAYYGVRAVLSIYIVMAAGMANGGLEFDHIQKGYIYTCWAVIQSLLPMFTGGFADRYGYKKSVAVALTISIAGYLLMTQQHTFWGFFIACMMVATGTAIFKPGIQGIVANSTTSQNASLAWGMFYMIVNIGGFVGPWVSASLRVMSWNYVFIASAVLLSFNYLFLLCFKEPSNGLEKDTKHYTLKDNVLEFFATFWNSIRNLFEPRLITFLLVFSGFWLMFMQLFDIMPNYIDDWVNTSNIMVSLGQVFHQPSMIAAGLAGHQIPPEQMVNIDAGCIILLMLVISWLSRRLPPVPAMVIGIAIASAGIVTAGFSRNGWMCVLGIVIFAIGEMLASPRKNEYLAMIAPPGKKGLYMGYVNFPQAIGWGFGSAIGGHMYQTYADKITLAKQHLASLGMSQEAINAIPKAKVMETLTAKLHLASTQETTQLLFNNNHPERIWFAFAAIGIASMLGMLIYDRVVERKRTGVISGTVSE